jgi:hypothetical protein
MKKLLFIALLAILGASNINATAAKSVINILAAKATKYSIKLKNDTGDEITVYNAGSGGSYRLAKNVITTIKMEEGDKLYTYEGGKKGKLLLTASADMDGKVQLYSKL